MIFDIVGGNEIDSNLDGKIDNEFWFKGYDLSLGFLWTPSQSFGVNSTYHYIYKRASSVEGQELAPYWGFSFSLGYMLVILNDDYKSSDDYLESMFIPSIVSGLSLEYQKYNGSIQYVENNLREILSITPFLDFKLAPKSQFRLGIPIKFQKSINQKAMTELNTFFQFSLEFTTIAKD